MVGTSQANFSAACTLHSCTKKRIFPSVTLTTRARSDSLPRAAYYMWWLLKGSVKEPNKFHNYETEKITREASDAAEYIELFGSSARDRHARRI